MTTDHDPYGVVPDGFCEAYGKDTIPQALDAAEKAKSTTSYDSMPRCPACGTVRIKVKGQVLDMPHRTETAYKCRNLHHFDEPAPPLGELEIYTDTTDLFEEGQRNGERLADALNDAVTEDMYQTNFQWVDPHNLDEEPRPGFSDELPDWQHGSRAEAIWRAICLSQPWSDDGGLTLRETAAYIPYSRAWVNSRRQEWRAGEYRDIVDLNEPPRPDAGYVSTKRKVEVCD